MVLDKDGMGIDTSREWKQNALLVADGGKVTPTPAYYVFRHLSQYVVPGATVVGDDRRRRGRLQEPGRQPGGGRCTTAPRPTSNYVVAIGGKKLQFAMPANGWATVKYTP